MVLLFPFRQIFPDFCQISAGGPQIDTKGFHHFLPAHRTTPAQPIPQEKDSFRFLIIPICFFLCHNYSLPLLSSMEALMNAWPALILIKAGSMDESVLPYVYIYL